MQMSCVDGPLFIQRQGPFVLKMSFSSSHRQRLSVPRSRNFEACSFYRFNIIFHTCGNHWSDNIDADFIIVRNQTSPDDLSAVQETCDNPISRSMFQLSINIIDIFHHTVLDNADVLKVI